MTELDHRAPTESRRRGRGDPPSEPDDVRQPPQDMHAEQSVLGALLLSKDAVADVLEVLGPDDFYRPSHLYIYDAILDLFGRGEPADAVTVAAELDRRGHLNRIGGAPYLHTLIAMVPTAANAGYYAAIVAEKAVLRRLVTAGTRVVQFGYAGAAGAEVATVVDRAQAEIYDVTRRRTAEDMIVLDNLLQPTMDELDAIASSGGHVSGVPTGFADLDALTTGLHGGQMIVVAARPGVGKALALDTPLVTPTGWTTMGQVAVGDELVGTDGRPTRVVAATDVMRERPCYTIEFDNGTTIIADAEHQWPTDRGTRITTELRPGVDVITAAAPLAGNHLASDIHPATAYAAGSWLADRPAARHLHLTVNDLRPYLRADRSQRASLLQGLLAGLGYATLDGPVVIHDNPRRPGVLDFVEELLAAEGIVPHRDRTTIRYGANELQRGHRIVAVTARPPVPVRCVQVDNHDHTYLAGHTMVPTHNSTLGLDFMRSCSIRHGMASVIFSLEMSKTEIVMRLLAAESRVKLQAMRSGRMTDEDWVKMSRRMGEISSAPLYIDDSPNLTMMEIRAKARRLKQKTDLRLVVVDYMQLMTSGKRFESRQAEVSDLSRSLKVMAKELDVPVVAISQLNRGPEQRVDKTPVASDLRESGQIEQDSDLIIMIHRPDAIDKDSPRAGEADLHLVKHRNGPQAVLTVAATLHIASFRDLARGH
ncbi:replicative DNA helicase (plasmid) [Mycolicibacterium aubagnense]|uniref:replicative DNA helicase n=1 Tax=Mycolicibacterium aubagnense TaxID=319707 RepID=UPI00244E0F36|nr:replicative DNA helicase [Mycolicibacterium aubagnense]WGI36009.1 replicative DNA helicase [Mycolicibacterium aubagnense]